MFTQNTTRDIFGRMVHLQWLDLSHNDLIEIDFDTFRNTKNLQVFFKVICKKTLFFILILYLLI